jgi:CubicO group peptidase (beta-lactamase class C family)
VGWRVYIVNRQDLQIKGKIMKKSLWLVMGVLLLAVLSACATLPDKPVLSETAQRIADTIVQDYGITSVQYAMIDNEIIIVSGSSGMFSKDGNRAVTTDDLYGIGSTSKMFATASVMVLRDRELLDLDRPVTAYLPEFTMADPRYADITVRMLLNHSSGLYGSSFGNTFLFNDANPVSHDTLLAKLATQRLKAAPGEMSEYCNDGFTLIELIVERISGMSYTEFITHTFLQPLGMDNTKTPQWDFDKDARMARVYIPGFDCAAPHDTANALATGGLYSTAEDLCSFAEVLMGAKPAILSEESVLMMQQEEYRKGLWMDEQGDNMFAYGLGWDSVHSYPFSTYGIQAFSKGGDTFMYHSSLLVIPEHRIAMAVVSSGGTSAMNYVFAATMLQELLLEKGIIAQLKSPWSFDEPVPLAIPDELQLYAGIYANNLSTVVIGMEGSTLTISHGDDSPQETYVYISEGLFQNAEAGDSLTFVRKEDGQVYIQNTAYGALPGVGELMLMEFKYQKIEPVPVSDTVLEAWSKRAGLRYFVASEKPSSQTYFNKDVYIPPLGNDLSYGYAFGGIRIVDENTAINTLKFRDATDWVFESQDGVEYLRAYDMVYVREDSFLDLNSQLGSCVIKEDGLSRYFLVGADIAGKTLVVDVPAGAAFAVYDTDNTCVHFSTICSSAPPALPLGGKVVFIGFPGDVFSFTTE